MITLSVPTAEQSTTPATEISLEIATGSSGNRVFYTVDKYSPMKTTPGRETFLHHSPVINEQALSGCVACAPAVPSEADSRSSVFPRANVFACACAEGQGKDSLGRCQTLKGPLGAPTIAPGPTAGINSGRFHPTNTAVKIQLPNGAPPTTDMAFAELRYTLTVSDYTITTPEGSSTTTTTTTDSVVNTIDFCGVLPGMASGVFVYNGGDVGHAGSVKLPATSLKNVVIKAVVCHPAHRSDVDSLLVGWDGLSSSDRFQTSFTVADLLRCPCHNSLVRSWCETGPVLEVGKWSAIML